MSKDFYDVFEKLDEETKKLVFDMSTLEAVKFGFDLKTEIDNDNGGYNEYDRGYYDGGQGTYNP